MTRVGPDRVNYNSQLSPISNSIGDQGSLTTTAIDSFWLTLPLACQGTQ
ncbi:conserved protein of unknown function [Limnospira indica PCC 8005]|uniref:Uncharacterized protein n=1 Tax=Limnospira indica PCC 8005 TaxID=376219 RepID=A0A9P1NZU1_9CYAN|nr:conserved protein of unknown function [Limnospira indica PCC 8005]